MNNIKTSIQAITITIFLFLFIFFISLFKGITLYNIEVNNIKIKKVYLKIHNFKLITKIYISSLPRNDKKIKLNKIITFLRYFHNCLNFFEELDIITPEFKFHYYKKFFIFSSKKFHIKTKGYLKTTLYKITLNLDYLILKDIIFKDVILTLKDKISFLKIEGIFHYRTNKIQLKGEILPFYNEIVIRLFSDKFNTKLNNFSISLSALSSKFDIKPNKNKINSTLKIKHLSIKNKLFKIKHLNNLKSEIYINLKDKSISSISFIKDIVLNYKNIELNATSVKITQNNENLTFNIKKSYSKQINSLYNIKSKNIIIQTNLKSQPTYLEAKNIKGNYKDIPIELNKLNLIYNKNKFNIKIKKSSIINNNFLIILKNIELDKNKNNLTYTIKSTKLISKRITASSSKIIGDTKKIVNKIVKGIVDSFNFKAQNNKFDIHNKILSSQKLSLNNVNLENLKVDFLKKYATFNSKSYFDDNLKEILKKELNLSIPLTQIEGENNISGKINFDKNISFIIKANLKQPIFKIEDLVLKSKEANVTVNENNTSFNLDNSSLKIAPKLILFFKGKGKVDYDKLLLIFNGIINKFKIYPILNLYNFKENLKMNLKTLEIFLQHSHTYIDLHHQNIIINNLKPILPFTPLKNLIENGILFISFKDHISILTFLKLKLPIFYKHNNKPIISLKELSKLKEDKIMMNIEINKNTIILYNQFIKFFMSPKEILLTLKNKDINLYPLEKFYLENNKTSASSNFDKNITINSKNANILYKNHKFLSQKAEIKKIDNQIFLKSSYKKSHLKGYTKEDYFLLEGKNFSKEEFIAFLPNLNFFKKINVDFTLVKSPDNFYIGNVYINNAIISKLKTLNNVMAFLNTIPALLSLKTPGFSAKGYKIKKGKIQYLFYKKILYIKKATIIGENIDFVAKGYIDLNKNFINLKATAILKLKIKEIPLIGKGVSYILFGKDGNIKVHIIIKGDLNNPKIEKDLGKDLIPNPFNLFKRVITLPFNLF